MTATTKEPIAHIKAVLFDMDGLLIDSEGIYTTVVNDILKPYGKQQTWEIKANLMGKPEREATLTLLSSLWPPTKEGEAYGPDCPFDIDNFLKDRNEVLLKAFEQVPQMQGAARLVQHLHKHNVPICVATGSKRRNYDIKTASHPDLFGPFADRVICGDDPRLTRGKPHPDIFLLAAREGLLSNHPNDEATKQKLGAQWTESLREMGHHFDEAHHLKGGEASILVFEDAKPGVQAAKAAGMHVVWVPDPELRALYPSEELGASQTINSLLEFDPSDWGLPPFDDQK
ncbi:HAD-like domain protein [Kalmanozyma brasiliensis GHG001]|uniref:Membrane coat complex Retromer, subunit VPS29/PEP11 n=1 Tax=Kalmanozyma brasiliensis (strain GHG001) TaxID=1365824 RepID=V5EXF7_KALBG|nr:HAD-like domain protein [Kalmanozyma brasiliensis GHG001]EST07129.1 HAD-like domain protein [Kalmanozyma brasiliensis GHG001]